MAASRPAALDGQELDAGRDAGVERGVVGVDDRVGKAADPRDHRHAAVAQAVELGQPAGLEARGHENGVGAALQQVRQRLVIAGDDADPAAMARGGGMERALERRSPEPSTASRAPARDQPIDALPSRSMPFCQVSRLTTAKIGPAAGSRPKRSSHGAACRHGGVSESAS